MKQPSEPSQRLGHKIQLNEAFNLNFIQNLQRKKQNKGQPLKESTEDCDFGLMASEDVQVGRINQMKL